MMSIRPLASLLPEDEAKFVLLILNRPLESEVTLLKHLWTKAVFKACADGGCNRLYKTLGDERDKFVPDIITGDFDSAESSVLEYYKNKGVTLVSTPEQDATDFTKCLRVTVEKTKTVRHDGIMVWGGFGGRVDHVFGNVETLFHAQTMTDKPLFLIYEGSLAILLSRGKHTIHVCTGLEAEWCGMIPIGCSCDHVTTTGLKWNLNDDVLKFGELISTSNTYDGSSKVTIENDQPLLWTMGYNWMST